MCKLHNIITAIRPGRISYNAGTQLQRHLAAQTVDSVTNFRNYLVLQEFNPVYTIGIRTDQYTQADESRLRALGADFERTNRGGLITFHGPGQLVAYPIINLKQFKPSMRWYVATIEQMVIDACTRMGVKNATTTADTGIWVGNNKICAIGVHGSHYVTTHGIGLNCNTDLSWFNHIVPCGIVGKGVTSLSRELQRHVTLEEAADVVLKCFAHHFQCQIVEESSEGTQKILKALKI